MSTGIRLACRSISFCATLVFFGSFANAETHDQYWAFDQPDITTLRSSPKKVFALYFPFNSISFFNRDPNIDFYATTFLDPEGGNGRYSDHGGYQRQRPVPRPIRPGTEDEWRRADYALEIQQAIDLGIDGFALDMLRSANTGPTPWLWDRINMIMDVANEVDPEFQIIVMPDMLGSEFLDNPEHAGNLIRSLADKPSAYRLPDGRLVVSPIRAELQTASWWGNLLDDLKINDGIDIAFVPLFWNLEDNAEEFSSISYGMSVWGPRSPTISANLPSQGVVAHANAGSSD